MTSEISFDDFEESCFESLNYIEQCNPSVWNGRLLSKEDWGDLAASTEEKLSILLLSSNDSKQVRNIAAQFAQIGAAASQIELGNRDIEYLLSDGIRDEEGRVFLLSKSNGKGFDDKISRFWKKHKKEIIIGAVIVTIVVVTVVVIAATTGVGTVAAGAVVSGGGAVIDSPTHDDSKKEQKAPPRDENMVFRVMDEDSVVRQEQLRKAGHIAKEQRYPNLVHSQAEIDLAQKKVGEEVDKFKGSLPSMFTVGDACKIAEIAGASAFSKGALAAGDVKQAVALTVAAAYNAAELAGDKINKIQTLYEPVHSAYEELSRMQALNKGASLTKCEKEDYKPCLEFHPTTPQIDEYKNVLIDRNNPYPNNQIIIE